MWQPHRSYFKVKMPCLGSVCVCCLLVQRHAGQAQRYRYQTDNWRNTVHLIFKADPLCMRGRLCLSCFLALSLTAPSSCNAK